MLILDSTVTFAGQVNLGEHTGLPVFTQVYILYANFVVVVQGLHNVQLHTIFYIVKSCIHDVFFVKVCACACV